MKGSLYINVVVQEPQADLWDRAALDSFLPLLQQAASRGLYEPDPLIPVQVAPSQQIFESYKASVLGS